MKKQNIDIYDFLQNNHINNIPILNDDDIILWGQNNGNVIEHYNSYLQNIIVPNSHGPIEKHPYINLYNNCFNLNNRFLLLGTFPPSTYFNNLDLIGLPNHNIQINNPLPFFYGNENNLWKFLFNMLPVNITIYNIINNLNHNRIAITDVFLYVQREKMINSADNMYNNIILNTKVKNIFNEDSFIETILFTSGALVDVFKNDVSALVGFRWILETYLMNFNLLQFSGDITGNGMYYEFLPINLNNVVSQQNGGIVWWLKFRDKKIKIINLPSPSGNAQRQMPKSIYFKKWVIFKAIQAGIPLPNQQQLETPINNYTLLYPNLFIGPITNQYRSEVYSMALNDTLQLI